ncbi:hypothetical protein [Streptomyces sp. HNM0574]|uniref:hypothetical protein n=1 Tax=Streptomyces sp. HNM0574 TaxID=2714954 RepID=UPI00146BEE1D|nr:hypothetical protein [Streptomyces sp. HNM0574]NLU70321.1 hypothetical protein [Streptomyces sp. HNM0574]
MRTSARITGVAAAAAAAALLVGGCSSGSDKGGSDSPGDSGGSSQGSQEGGGGSHVDAKALQGGWATSLTGDSSKDTLILAVAKDRVVLLGKASCSGTVAADSSPVSLDLTCQKGGDYSKGTVEHADAKKMTVKWESGETSEFTKASDTEGNPAEGLPTDLPTELPSGAGDLPSDLPTDAAQLPN